MRNRPPFFAGTDFFSNGITIRIRICSGKSDTSAVPGLNVNIGQYACVRSMVFRSHRQPDMAHAELKVFWLPVNLPGMLLSVNYSGKMREIWMSNFCLNTVILSVVVLIPVFLGDFLQITESISVVILTIYFIII